MTWGGWGLSPPFLSYLPSSFAIVGILYLLRTTPCSSTQPCTHSPNRLQPCPQRPLATVMAAYQISDMITGVQDIIGYNFTDPFILWEALQAAGSGNTFAGNRRFPEGNKRLAVLGDTILQLVLVRDWYETALVRGILVFLSTIVALVL